MIAGDAVRGDKATIPPISDPEGAAYVKGIEEELAERDRAARRRLAVYRVLRFSMLAASAITPVVALLHAPALVTASVGAVVFLAEGAIQLTRLNDRAVLDIERTSVLGREYRLYRLAAGDYKSSERLELFVRRAEEIRAESDIKVLHVLRETFSGSAGSPSPSRQGSTASNAKVSAE